MPGQESLFCKIFSRCTPFCTDFDDKDSYVIEVSDSDSN